MDNPQNYFTLEQQRERNDLHEALKKIGAGLDTLHQDQQRIAAATEMQATATNQQVWPRVCAPLLFLAIGVDGDGSFNLRSHIGLFLVAAVDCEGFTIGDTKYPKDPKDWQPGLQQLAPPPASGRANPRKLIGRDAFVATCLLLQARPIDGSQGFCIPPEITGEHFGRFYDCAPALLGLVEESMTCVRKNSPTPTEQSA